MGFWSFGREPADVELASRVVSAATQNGYRVRGKLTIHFDKPQTQADANAAADRCASLAVALLRESTDHERVIGAEQALSAELAARYPADIARSRAVELAALHVVGDPALSDDLRRASTASGSGPMTPIAPPTQPPSSSAPRPSTPPVPRSNPPPQSAPATAPSQAPPRRRGSSQMRSIQSLLMPPGTPPAAMGAFAAPLVRDSAARLLVGFLRAHDLIAVRGIAIDEGSAEVLASLVPVSDAQPGGYAESRAGELARWQTTLGAGAFDALRREIELITAYLMRESLARAQVSEALAVAVMDALYQAAFPEQRDMRADLARYPSAISHDFVGVVARNLTRIVSGSEDPHAMAAALSPLVALVQDDLGISAAIIKQSSGA